MTAFGLLLPTREAVMSQATPDFGKMYDLAERAEALGFDSIWVGDSVLARPRFEPLTTLAAVAARTKRVKLGSAVLVPALRQPVVLANEIANLDHVSAGRLILGRFRTQHPLRSSRLAGSASSHWGPRWDGMRRRYTAASIPRSPLTRMRIGPSAICGCLSRLTTELRMKRWLAVPASSPGQLNAAPHG